MTFCDPTPSSSTLLTSYSPHIGGRRISSKFAISHNHEHARDQWSGGEPPASLTMYPSNIVPTEASCPGGSESLDCRRTMRRTEGEYYDRTAWRTAWREACLRRGSRRPVGHKQGCRNDTCKARHAPLAEDRSSDGICLAGRSLRLR